VRPARPFASRSAGAAETDVVEAIRRDAGIDGAVARRSNQARGASQWPPRDWKASRSCFLELGSYPDTGFLRPTRPSPQCSRPPARTSKCLMARDMTEAPGATPMISNQGASLRISGSPTSGARSTARSERSSTNRKTGALQASATTQASVACFRSVEAFTGLTSSCPCTSAARTRWTPPSSTRTEVAFACETQRSP
jgi:hypothetical protein